MKTHTLEIGEVNVIRGHVIYKCYGLGSCIALFLSDPSAQVYGGAHLFVSKSSGRFPGATETVDQLLGEMKNLGSSLKHVRAKLTGGASIFTGAGKKNLDELIPVLRQRRIFVSASDVGGAVSRTVSFHSSDEEVNIINSDRIRYSI